MSIFFGFLFLLSLLALVVGLIAPKAVLFFSKTKTRKRAAMLYLLLVGVSIVGLVATTQDPQSQVVAEATQTEPAAALPPKKDVGKIDAQAEAIALAKQKQQEQIDKKLAESKRFEAEQAAKHKEEVEKKRKAEAEKKRMEQESAQQKAVMFQAYCLRQNEFKKLHMRAEEKFGSDPQLMEARSAWIDPKIEALNKKYYADNGLSWTEVENLAIQEKWFMKCN